MMTIYGLFDGDKCLYVGKTEFPWMRIGWHSEHTLPGIKFKMKTLRRVRTREKAAKVEMEEMRRMFLAGHPLKNRILPKGCKPSEPMTHMAVSVPFELALKFDKKAFPVKRAKKLRELVDRYTKGEIK